MTARHCLKHALILTLLVTLAPVLFCVTDSAEAGRVIEKLITATGFSPVRVAGIDKSIRIEVGGDLHESGKLGKLVSVKQAEALI